MAALGTCLSSGRSFSLETRGVAVYGVFADRTEQLRAGSCQEKKAFDWWSGLSYVVLFWQGSPVVAMSS